MLRNWRLEPAGTKGGAAVVINPFINDSYEAAVVPEKWQSILDRRDQTHHVEVASQLTGLPHLGEMPIDDAVRLDLLALISKD
jgi:hypothetical protein